MKKNLLTSMVALALLASCNNDYDGLDIAGSKLKVKAFIEDVNSRVSEDGTAWEIDDVIGVSDNATTPNSNIKYKATTTSGDFAKVTNDIYLKGDADINFTAYYPFSGTEGTSTGEVSFKIVGDDGNYVGHDAVDFMYATGTASRENPELELNFSHQMSKVSLTIVDNTEASTPASRTDEAAATVSYTLKNIIIDGKFNTETGVITKGTTQGNVTVTTTLGVAKSIILLPASDNNENATPIELQITIGDKTYTGSFTPGLQASKQYNYKVDLTQTEENIALQITSSTMTGWTSETEENVDVNQQITYNETLEVGDFYCTDGTVVDKAFNLNDLDKTIAGVVFYVGDVTEEDPILAAEHPTCKNGLVVALNNANDEGAAFGSTTDGGVYTYWGNLDDQGDYKTTQVKESDDNITISDATTKLGYNNTKLLLTASECTETIPDKSSTYSTICDVAAQHLNDYRTNNAVTNSGSSDWYIPSWAELDLLRTKVSDIETSIEKAEGTLEVYSSFALETNDCSYWSSTERKADGIWVSPLTDTTEKQQNKRRNTGFYRFILAF